MVEKRRKRKEPFFCAAPNSYLTTRVPTDQVTRILQHAPFNVDDEIVVDAIAELFGAVSAEDMKNYPSQRAIIPIRPTLHAGRMLQQQSCFTLHLLYSPLIPEESMKILEIPHSTKSKIRKELSKVGIRRSTLFPELDSVSLDLLDRFE